MLSKNEEKMKYYKRYDNAKRNAQASEFPCAIVSGSNGGADIYYIVRTDIPNKLYRLAGRSHSDGGGNRVCWVDSNGSPEVIENASDYRVHTVLKGLIPAAKIIQYLHGYYTRLEEKSEKIRRCKEAARYSHAICDVSGAYGHELRQQIRREWQSNN